MKNRTLTALQEQGNLLGLGSVVAIAAASTSFEPLLFGAVIEAVYLVFVPRSRWFAARLARQNENATQAQREQLKSDVLTRLRPDLQMRFARLEMQRARIERQAAAVQKLSPELWPKLDFLLDQWLNFALKDEQFRAYLLQARAEKLTRNSQLANEPNDNWARETIDLLQSDYDGELGQIQVQLDRETDADTRAILVKRLEILERRREFIGRIGKIVGNLSQQLALLEDTFGLIGDELCARAPEQLLGDIEEVVSQTKATTRVLDEMAPYEQILAQL